ncbi:MAG: helix-turn-helix domain-containing protein [Kineosporiaceae bacterium]
MSTDDLMTTGAAAALLRCSRQHVVDLCDRGELRFVWAGRHRRIARGDLEVVRRPALTREQARSLWLHQAVAGHLVVDPGGVIARAQKNLNRIRAVHSDGWASAWLDRWEQVLAAGPDHVLQALTSRSEEAIELRQNSPFAGVLTEDERQGALGAFRETWQADAA